MTFILNELGVCNLIITIQDCVIIILDHTVQVSIDQCERCKIFIGPVEGR
jgi:hypothetical protein